MLVSTKGRYAARMLADIAVHQGDGYVPMKEIAARQQLSKKYLETLTPALADAGILSIRRGKAGGYRLAVSPEDLTLWRIICLTEGPMHAVACLEAGENPCDRRADCPTLPVWTGLEKVVREYLESVTLRQLIDRPEA